MDTITLKEPTAETSTDNTVNPRKHSEHPENGEHREHREHREYRERRVMSDWTYIDGLADAHPGLVKTDYDIPRTDYRHAKPELEMLAVTDGARVVRLAFRDGDVMADHTAPAPVLILGQTGSVDVTITGSNDAGESVGVENSDSGEARANDEKGGNASSDEDDGDDGDTDHVTLTPGTAVHIASQRVHSLTALEPSTVTLLILE
jgi:quercetin dioxygenase-like cupin family protein